MADNASDESGPARSELLAAPCRHLRTNGMYLFDNLSEDEDYESSGFWCQRTMKPFGPDDELVNRPECRNSGRSCYEPV